MKNVKVKNISFGDDLPKICVPVTAIAEDEILREFSALNTADIDLAEFRADYFEFINDRFKVTDLLGKIRKIYNKPLLFTLRTKKEGGASHIDDGYYLELNNMIIERRLADLIDIEFFSQSGAINYTLDSAEKNQVKTILSYHNFMKTPSVDEITAKVNKMSEYGDIAKIAVMANTEEDVLTLLSASLKIKQEKKGPFIAIAMGPLGIISRISCELFGSCMTYASYKEKSAPGQINYKLTREILKILHV